MRGRSAHDASNDDPSVRPAPSIEEGSETMSRRYWYLAALAVAVVIATIVSSVHRPLLTAQASGCNMTRYKAIDGMLATAEADGLTLNWVGEMGADLRMRLAVDNGKPIVRDLAIRRKGGQWATLGHNLSPEFDVTTGRRRIGFDQLNPYREMKVPLTPDLIEREKWNAFWDAPLEVPGRVLPTNTPDAAQLNKLLDLPRQPAEIKRATVDYRTSGCDVASDGARIEVSYP